MFKLSMIQNRYAPLAQLDRASGYGPEGQGFESLTACQKGPSHSGWPFLAHFFKSKGFESCPKAPVGLSSTSSKTGRYFYQISPSHTRGNLMQANPLRRAIVGDHSARLEKGNCKKADAFFSSVLRVSSSPNRTRVAGLRFGTGIFSVKLRRVVADCVSFAAAFPFSKPTPPLIHFVAPPFKIKAARSLRASPTTSALRCAGF